MNVESTTLKKIRRSWSDFIEKKGALNAGRLTLITTTLELYGNTVIQHQSDYIARDRLRWLRLGENRMYPIAQQRQKIDAMWA
ncbi:hypothetical protein EVAR_86426_1 [Eumeta japonica]|uniref:Uncharacterized protein n=1 Tax=Eumeta variegata TaxID=151549 RepID=A0A4C1Z9Q2_EUMVA|nr:hypothetical protein EVAR_86426_1 [Eumeta japonica]